MRLLVTGGRDYRNAARVDLILNILGPSVVGHGNAPGADTLARIWAADNRVPCEAYPADWASHGRAAGPIRNRTMLRLFKPDLVVAFPGGNGTADMVRVASEAGMPLLDLRLEQGYTH